MDEELVPEILPVDARLSVSGPTSSLLDIVSRALRVVPAKEVIPGTGHVLLEAKSSKAGVHPHLRAVATDGTITVSSVSDDLKVRVAGGALIPGQKFVSILRMAPSDTVNLQIVGNEAVIRSGRSQWRVKLVAGDALPALPPLSDLSPVQIDRQSFLKALKVALKAASHQTARASLMQVRVKDGSAVGTDGNRLHKVKFSTQHEDFSVSIPVQTAAEVIRLLESSKDEYFLAGTNGRHMGFIADKDYVISSSLVVNFPDPEPLILHASMNARHRLIVGTQDLLDAVKRVRVNADPDFSSIFLSISKGPSGEWGLAVHSRDRQGNSAYEYIDYEWSGPEELKDFCLNHRHLVDLLDSYGEDKILFKVGEDTQSSKAPLLVEDDGNFVGLLQQMRSDYLD